MTNMARAQQAYDNKQPQETDSNLHEHIYEQEKALLTQALAEGCMLRDFRKDGSQFEYDPVDEISSEVKQDAFRAFYQAIALDSAAEEIGLIAKEMFAQAMHAYCTEAANREAS